MDNIYKDSYRNNPRENANFFSVWFFWYTIDMFKTGYNHRLDIKDLYTPLKCDRSEKLGDKLESNWKHHLEKRKKINAKPNLLLVTAKTFLGTYVRLGCILAIMDICLRLIQPHMLGGLLDYFRADTKVTKNQAYFYASIIVICNGFYAMFMNQYLINSFHAGFQVRTAFCSLIYRKSLNLSSTALRETASGKAVNLLSNDVSRFDIVSVFLNHMWVAPVTALFVMHFLWVEVGFSGIVGIGVIFIVVPLQGETVSGKAVNLLSNDVSRFDVVSILLNYMWVAPVTAMFVMNFLWVEVGLAGIIGVGVIFIVVPLQGFIGKLSSKFRLQTAYKTDERVRLIDEVISAIQVIKMYAWEIPYLNIIKLARKAELKVIKKTSCVRGLYMTFNMFTTRVALFATLLTMTLMDQKITTSKAFVIASYFNILSNSMGSMFVRGISEVAEMIVSMKRLQLFLMLEENEISTTKHRKLNSSDDFALKLNNVTAKYDNVHIALESISLTIRPGQLIGVIGAVGSGKSSLFQLLLNELHISSGNLTVNGSIGYSSQETWVFNATIRQNILFGSKFDQEHYQRVINACALWKDFLQLPNGDLTVIGERGASLSGGQKARINLARAVYRQNVDIYLLDDPLSAVDSHVAKHIFHKCINGLLKNKTRILVTHQIQFLKNADQIIVLNQGRIETEGTYLEIGNNPAISHIHLTRDEHDKDDDKKHAKRLSNSSTISDFSIHACNYSDEFLTSDYEDNLEPNREDNMELSSKGTVKGSLSFKYFCSGSNICYVLFVFLLYIAAQVAASLVDFWVSFWSQQEELRYHGSQNITDSSSSSIQNDGILSTKTCLNVYTILIVALFCIALSRSFFFYHVCMRASYKLHNSMVESILKTTMQFFHTNPSGRIINRFSKDIGGIDEMLPKTILDSCQIILSMIGSLILASIVNVYFLIPVFLMGILFIILRNLYLKTSKNLKRLEGITRSPIFTHLNTTLQGLVTIRAFGTQEILKNEFDQHQNLHSSACWMFIASSSAFGFLLDVFCFFYTALVIYSFLWLGEVFFSGQVGLAITQSTALMGLMQWGMRQSAEVSNQLMSVERVLEYTQLPNEEADNKFRKIDTKWPSQGEIRFSKVNAKYSKDSAKVLNNLSFTIHPKEKIGIVGRTGAGKSSLIQALFRLIDTDGSIEIDRVDISTIQLSSLRSKISIIPQDPVLFSGTLRRNLDPFEEYPDYVIWKSLDEVKLKSNIRDDLMCSVLDHGANFSVGERQLICLARAIVRNNKILVLDEATANVDLQTDNLIQQTIREKFRNCTVLTVAHRLNTIMDSDRVIVIDNGNLVEFDHPYQLLQNADGHFTKMVNECGPVIAKQLVLISKQNFEQKQ